MKKISVIITGSTGMIGESVLDQCLKHEDISRILVINRRASGYNHPKLTEIVHSNLSDLSVIIKHLTGYDACFFCIGVTSVGKSEEQYTSLTHDMTLNFAKSLAGINPVMTFCYISGAGTDSSEKGRSMWARVKGKTENDLMRLPFKKVYNFRPGALIPYLKVKPTQTYNSIRYFIWLMVLLRPLFPNAILKLKDFSIAMINSVLYGYPKNILETGDIKALSKMN